MNDRILSEKVHSAMEQQIKERGYAAPVDVLMDIGILTKEKYEDWRFGRVPYLEKVCNANLHKLSSAMHYMRVYAKKNGLKPSLCVYKKWGKKGMYGNLRFSKSGNADVERWYATHLFCQHL